MKKIKNKFLKKIFAKHLPGPANGLGAAGWTALLQHGFIKAK